MNVEETPTIDELKIYLSNKSICKKSYNKKSW